MKKEYLKLPINQLKKRSKNPKKHDDEVIERSIKKIGFIDDIIVDENNVILSGHGRLDALKKLNYDKVDVIRVSGLTEKLKNLYILTANKSVENGGWYDDVLKEYTEEDLGFAGFKSEELDKIFNLEVEEDEVPEVPEKPVSKLGDLYQLGNHRLLCGDATKKEDVERLMAGERADMVFTDPPYGINIVKIRGKTRLGKIGVGGKTKFGKVGIDKWVPANYYLPIKGDDKEFNPQFLLNLSKKVLIFGANYFANKLPNSKCWLVWDKTGEDYIQNSFADCELIWTNLDKPSRIYRCKWRGLLKEKSSEDINKRIHPTQKPIKLLADILQDYSRSGDIILDLYGGSGSTLIACEQLKRKCRMMEIDSVYCNIIIKRWEKYTGKKAKKI